MMPKSQHEVLGNIMHYLIEALTRQAIEPRVWIHPKRFGNG